MLSTKTHQLRQKVPPAQPLVPKRGQNRCATQEYRHRESTQWCSCTMLLQDYSWGIPVAEAVSFTQKAMGGFFSQLFQWRQVFLSSLHFVFPAVKSTATDTDPRVSPNSSRTKPQTDPDWLRSFLSSLCFCQRDFCSADFRLNFTHVYTT